MPIFFLLFVLVPTSMATYVVYTKKYKQNNKSIHQTASSNSSQQNTTTHKSPSNSLNSLIPTLKGVHLPKPITDTWNNREQIVNKTKLLLNNGFEEGNDLNSDATRKKLFEFSVQAVASTVDLRSLNDLKPNRDIAINCYNKNLTRILDDLFKSNEQESIPLVFEDTKYHYELMYKSGSGCPYVLTGTVSLLPKLNEKSEEATTSEELETITNTDDTDLDFKLVDLSTETEVATSEEEIIPPNSDKIIQNEVDADKTVDLSVEDDPNKKPKSAWAELEDLLKPTNYFQDPW